MNGIIVAPQREAAEAGAKVLMAGGNAVDAAIACALVQGVVDPQMAGIAGFGTMQVYLPERDVHTCLDFHATCPAKATADMWANIVTGETRDGFGFLVEGKINDLGYGAIAVPTSLRAYEDAASSFGTWDWKDLVRPAVEQARKGVRVRPQMHAMWLQPESKFGRIDLVDKLRWSRTGREIYFHADGALKTPGEAIVNEDLANTLELIGSKGANVFYKGEIAERIVADMAANGGLITFEDLANVRTKHLPPLIGDYRGHKIATSNPPAAGVVLIQMLNFLEKFDLREMEHNSAEFLKYLAEAMKFATRDKEAFVGDPAFIDVPIGKLTSKAYALEQVERARRGDKVSVTRLQHMESKDTTQVCVSDKRGNIVTMTHSLGTASGVITDGLGFMYNGCMNVFDPRPGRPGSIAPGKSRYSSMTPSIVFKGDKPRMVVGAPGGAHITGAVLQSILNVVDFGMSAVEAVAAPRISATSDIIDVSNRLPEYVTDQLEQWGYPIVRSIQSFAFGAPHALVFDGKDWSGGADPQRDGVALQV
ncbi:gamma-glutamyltranspeptidase/glutathione hydrolase [Rhizobium aquaticum]|uniref:Glutathione hydrolase proenzyme n=1 Tax=Rhizobium aquaticum TaxID=1549636 RepID=A0ABV2J6F3_9HYPH